MPGQTRFPKNNLPTDSMKWARAVESVLNTLERAADSIVNRDGNNSSSTTASMAKLSEQVGSLIQTNQTLQATVNTLTAAGQVVQAEAQPNATIASVGFYNGDRPTVTITSPTGRIAVQFGGSINSGNAEFVFTAVSADDNATTYMARAQMRLNYARRLALSGGASFTPSLYRNYVLNVDPNVPVTISLEVYAETAGVVFVGGSILASASL